MAGDFFREKFLFFREVFFMQMALAFHKALALVKLPFFTCIERGHRAMVTHDSSPYFTRLTFTVLQLYLFSHLRLRKTHSFGQINISQQMVFCSILFINMYDSLWSNLLIDCKISNDFCSFSLKMTEKFMPREIRRYTITVFTVPLGLFGRSFSSFFSRMNHEIF